MKLLSLRRRTWSLFDNLAAIFGRSERGAHLSHGEGFAPASSTRIEGESRPGSSVRASRAPRDHVFVEPKSTPPKKREDGERERKRKRGREPRPSPLLGKGRDLLHQYCGRLIPGWSSLPLLGLGRDPMSRVEVGVTSASSSHVTSTANPVSLDSPASGGPIGSSPLGLRAGSKAMTPLAFRDPALYVPPLDVIGFSTALRTCIFQEAIEYPRKDLADQQGLVRQCTQEWAQLVSKQNSLSEEVARLSRELENVKAEMEELKTRGPSLSSRRDSSWEALHQWSRELEQLDSDSAMVANLANLTVQEISHLREEKRVMLRCAEQLKAMIEESLDCFLKCMDFLISFSFYFSSCLLFFYWLF
ncbi:hypothetical protein AMTR_s00087p00040780 [Amborella trichopoda]|uniref:Uncharacterized protein n=1 Tax=Amborella trichopoda TaxID=13333 RepID=W1P4H8_AMBTC|nr:hypothetical protein AMTR_s00087p00040780 [Amborella trichopoda]